MPVIASPKAKSKNAGIKATSDGSRRSVRTQAIVTQRKENSSRVNGPHTGQEATDCERAANLSDTEGNDVMRSKGIHDEENTGDHLGNELGPGEVTIRGASELVIEEDEPMHEEDDTTRSYGLFEDEEALDVQHSEAEWVEIEKRLQSTNMLVAFSIDEPTILVPEQGFWGLPELASGIVQVCASKGVHFEPTGLQPSDGKGTVLLGKPRSKTRQLWQFLRKGYMKVHGATIWVSPGFTGRKQSNLDLTELEYSNANYLSAEQLQSVLRVWGASDAIIVSHGASDVRQGKWPAIACITNAITDTNTGEPRFSFRLFFDCADTANRVYGSFLERNTDRHLRVEDGRTIRLTPVQHAEWCMQRMKMIRPSAASELANLSKRLHIFGVRPEIDAGDIQTKLIELGYGRVSVSIQPGRWWGTLMMQDEDSARRLYAAYGVNYSKRIFIGNIRLFVNKPGEDGGLRCFKCGRSGHFSRECRQRVGEGPDRRTSSSVGGLHSFGRANSRWKSLSRVVQRREEDGGHQLVDHHRRHREWPHQLRARDVPHDAMQQFAPATIQALIADQVREQSSAMVQQVEMQIRRHAHEVDTRLQAHDTAIQAMQVAQASTSSDVKGIASMLELVTVCGPPVVTGSPVLQQGMTVDTPTNRTLEPREGSPWSSDDSSNSEAEDMRLLLEPDQVHTARHRRGRRRRRWQPHLARQPHVEISGERTVHDDILRREHFAEQFLGDKGEVAANQGDKDIRIATANINKGFWEKMRRETCTWFLANQLDFLAVSDAALGETEERIVWGRAQRGGNAPALLVVGHQRVAIVMDLERWQSRWVKNATCYSNSGRSICITLRLGGRSRLQLIATYCPDTPHRNDDDTQRERRWIVAQLEEGRQRGYLSVVAGDFNTYPDEHLDRQGDGIREPAARRASAAFREWTVEQGITSTFKHRFPSVPRFTYQNGRTKTALDDVYISASHVHQIRQSGIWLYSLNHSDHVGTSFVTIALSRAQRVRTRLQNVEQIKVLPVKHATQEDLQLFSSQLAENISSGALSLVDPLVGTEHPPTELRTWLNDAIANLYKCMYQTAKQIWGESSQGRRNIDRAVSIKRTMRCHGQFKAVRRLQQIEGVNSDLLLREFRKVQWPKWVVFPERVPPASPHAEGAKILRTWMRSAPPDELAELHDWLDSGWGLWKSVIRTRRSWRQRRREEGRRAQRKTWLSTGQMNKLLKSTIGTALPPVHIQGGLVGEPGNYEYVETRAAVTVAMKDLLDSWIPPDQRTTEPLHLTSGAVEDEDSLPQFIKDWMLEDIKAGGTHQQTFTEESRCWRDFVYDEAMQLRVDSLQWLQ